MPFVIYGMEMIKTKWANLPNAVHIDRVIASAKAHPDHWAAAWGAVREAAWDDAWEAVRDKELVSRNVGRISAWYTTWWATRDTGHEVSRYAARGAILALCVYDECAYMLDSDPGELAILAEFGDNRAILLLPACKAFHSIKEIA